MQLQNADFCLVGARVCVLKLLYAHASRAGLEVKRDQSHLDRQREGERAKGLCFREVEIGRRVRMGLRNWRRLELSDWIAVPPCCDGVTVPRRHQPGLLSPVHRPELWGKALDDVDGSNPCMSRRGALETKGGACVDGRVYRSGRPRCLTRRPLLVVLVGQREISMAADLLMMPMHPITADALECVNARRRGHWNFSFQVRISFPDARD